uniref:Zgc:113054 n=1 Tax=Oryzias sinensis TaxID=183150 RepID=A0A8C8DPN5_9TELE
FQTRPSWSEIYNSAATIFFIPVPDTPMEVIVDLLTKAKDKAVSCSTVPEELKGHLQKALDIASGLDEYLEKMTTQESEPLRELYEKTMSHDWDQVHKEGKTIFQLPKECITGHVEGQTLKMLIHMSQAKRVLEIGMFTGYGALSMAEGLPDDGLLIACELEPYLKEFAQPIFDKSPHGKKIVVKSGPAMDTLKASKNIPREKMWVLGGAGNIEEWKCMCYLSCPAAGRVMLRQGYGKIINTASMASLIVPHPQKQLSYNASKAGVVKLTQTLGTEWIDRGVRVNCISPGIVDTPLIHSEDLKPLLQRWLSDIPAGRLAQVTDLQAAVVYLASEASDYMTGHNLVIEGGQSLW